MHPLLDKLHNDHINLARVLDLLERQLDALRDGQEPAYELVVDVLEYPAEYADEVHHRSEDRIFARLKDRDDAAGETARELLDQHQDVINLTREFQQVMDQVLHGTVISREDVERRGRAFLDFQRQHLDLEEERMFPMAQELLNTKTLDEIQADLPTGADPVFGAKAKVEFERLLRELSQ